ncbi:hypothetical protein [Streptomyces barringtoniae]|uniref:hypothetical protein n=1 Tax=Streptomyces barringtoniae TaxID=2892029 RepID=UPI001E2E93FD|nr:hypothetical protein [Streptomyces barringtoniae]MCC5479838.1 hypothetical protein [Streptomyces barringtoniae]
MTFAPAVAEGCPSLHQALAETGTADNTPAPAGTPVTQVVAADGIAITARPDALAAPTARPDQPTATETATRPDQLRH